MPDFDIIKDVMARYQLSIIEPNWENQNNTHVFHFNLYIDYFDKFLEIRNRYSSYSSMLIFLLSKYSERLQRISQRKKNCRKIYQPSRNHYKSQSIRITDAAHELLSNYSRVTGLSMSYLIRLLIEWENHDYSDRRGNIDYIPVWERDDSLVTTISRFEIYYEFSSEEGQVIEHFRPYFRNRNQL